MIPSNNPFDGFVGRVPSWVGVESGLLFGFDKIEFEFEDGGEAEIEAKVGVKLHDLEGDIGDLVGLPILEVRTAFTQVYDDSILEVTIIGEGGSVCATWLCDWFKTELVDVSFS